MRFTQTPIVALAALATSIFSDVAVALSRHQVLNPRNPLSLAAPPGDEATSYPYVKNATFEQLIDHSNPSLGTFSQFYYYSTQYWKGPGSPVVFFTPGEIDVVGYQSYTTTSRTTGVIAEQIGAAVIVIEHRYWGFSSPYADLTTENMQYQTTENAIADLNYFALHADLPFDNSGKSLANNAPWVLVGGSYSGALTAWTESVTKPSVMWAYYASSAVIETIGNYWSYFLPEIQHMPQNCSNDINIVVDFLDLVGEFAPREFQQQIKSQFGLEGVEHYDDFMSALANGPYLWQGNQFYENTGFFQFCDYIEGVPNGTTNGELPGAWGVGLGTALNGYATWMKEILLPGYCESSGFSGEYNVECFDSYNRSNPLYSDDSLTNQYDRQWDYFLCGGFGWWQNGSPGWQRTAVSRFIDNHYWVRQCGEWFPPENGFTYGLNAGNTYNTNNQYTGGWFGFENSTRLLFVSGTNDPWRESQIVSSFRPGGPQQSTPQVPIFDVPGGYHTSDLITKNGEVNEGCAEVQQKAIAQIVAWVNEYPKTA